MIVAQVWKPHLRLRCSSKDSITLLLQYLQPSLFIWSCIHTVRVVIMSEFTTFTEGEFYEGHFDSRAYVKSFYSCSSGHADEKNYLTFALRCLSRVFSAGKQSLSIESLDLDVLFFLNNFDTNVCFKGEHKGKRLIDVGSGPTIHSVLSACEHYDEIVLSDFANNNRREIEKWLKNQEGCLDWKPMLQYVCELEGKRWLYFYIVYWVFLKVG